MSATSDLNLSSSPRFHYIWVISFVWGLELLLLLVAQITFGGLGLSVHPTGEDRVWMEFLSHPGLQPTHDWWALASRNPLAPWWYLAFSPLINAYPDGIYLARKLLDLFQAVSVALLIGELGRRRSSFAPLVCGLLVLLWNFSGYMEQILFVMLISIGFSTLSLYFYVRYLNSRRSTAFDLAVSVVLFLIALATYSIQCGVPIAVALLSFVYGREAVRSDGGWAVAVETLIDVALFGSIFAIFTMIWVTTSGPTSSFFSLNWHLILRQIGISLKEFAWHSDTSMLMKSTFAHWSSFAPVLLFFVFVGVFYALLRQYRLSEREASFYVSRPIVIGGLVAICLVIPTIGLEATSTIWYPGSRSRMVQQVFQPLFYLALIAFVTFSFRKDRGMQALTCGAALLCGFAVIIGAEYNRKLVALTTYENNLISSLKVILPQISRPTSIFVRLDNDDWYGGQNAFLNRILVQLAYKSDRVWLDAIYKGPVGATESTVRFRKEKDVVFSPARQKDVALSEALFIDFDGSRAVRLNEIDESTFHGFSAIYERTNPFIPKEVELRCPLSFDFDDFPPGRGWSVPETAASGSTFVWMNAKEATIDLPNACTGPLHLEFHVLQPIALDILDSLNLNLDGAKIPLKRRARTDGTYDFDAVLPSQANKAAKDFRLTFDVVSTVVPQGDARSLALPFDWIKLSPD